MRDGDAPAPPARASIALSPTHCVSSAASIDSRQCGAMLIRVKLIAQAAPNIPSTQAGNTPDSNFFRIFYGMRNDSALPKIVSIAATPGPHKRQYFLIFNNLQRFKRVSATRLVRPLPIRMFLRFLRRR
ncbi:hypothetical protein [Burkholderia ubonensis]|uniref:hypothetical protein n=1 Tax=Burkholderia ubonensis TaxID=101571 RepID=UPI0012FA9366|nr:hypothetical protein [Burkholderia ubonensis]